MRLLCWLSAVALAVAAAGCEAQSRPSSAPSGPATTAAATGPATTAAAPVTSVAPAPPTPPASVPESGLGAGDRSDQVRAIEQRLDSLHYYVGQVDDVFDDDTTYGVTAFEKVNGMERTGRVTPDVANRLSTVQAPAPLVPNGGPSRVEIDLPHQVLFLYEGGGLSKVLSISTGSGEDYCSAEGCATAVTPPGSYVVDYHADGWVTSSLGRLYNPVYFDPKQGLAIHGFEDVPSDPASHGCVRIPMSAAEWFPSKAPKGTPVYVWDGQTALQPVGAPAKP